MEQLELLIIAKIVFIIINQQQVIIVLKNNVQIMPLLLLDGMILIQKVIFVQTINLKIMEHGLLKIVGEKVMEKMDLYGYLMKIKA